MMPSFKNNVNISNEFEKIKIKLWKSLNEEQKKAVTYYTLAAACIHIATPDTDGKSKVIKLKKLTQIVLRDITKLKQLKNLQDRYMVEAFEDEDVCENFEEILKDLNFLKDNLLPMAWNSLNKPINNEPIFIDFD